MRAPSGLSAIEDSGAIVVVGELDAAAAPALDQVIRRAEPPVLLDLRMVTFIDSYGLNVLVRHHERLGASGSRLSIVRPSPPVVRILDLTGLTGLLAQRADATFQGRPGMCL